VEVLYERVAGLDIGKKTLTVCVRTPGPRGGRRAQTRTFSTMTRSLQVMRDWLLSEGVTIAAMESTSTYWKGAFYCLEEVLEVWLVNAAHIKAISRRKTDVKDAEWIAQLLECGLLRPSFVPPPDIRRLRMLTRYRVQLMGDRTREITRLELMLEDASVKLSAVAASLTSVSARAMLGALIAGESDPHRRASSSSSVDSRPDRSRNTPRAGRPRALPARRPGTHRRRQRSSGRGGVGVRNRGVSTVRHRARREGAHLTGALSKRGDRPFLTPPAATRGRAGAGRLRSKEQRRVPPSATSSSRARPAGQGADRTPSSASGASSSLSPLRSASRSRADGGQYTAEHGGMHLVGQAKPCANVAQSVADQRNR
jgi:Transposase